GVGFSVEPQYAEKLPAVPRLRESYNIIRFEDSAEGWALGYKELIDRLYAGEIPKWDLSEVRPAGAPLKTMGGRASGPEPLDELLHYTVHKFKQEQRHYNLQTDKLHDIMCKIADVVVVGGVRRSAMISLGGLHDQAHALAKSGEWWKDAPERRLANNSAVYLEKPSMGQFMEEWTTIYKSGSGERGIFNREASQLQASKFGLRSKDIDYGTNPCSEIILRPNQFCNLSTVMVREDDTPETLTEKIELATIIGTMQATLTHFPILRPI